MQSGGRHMQVVTSLKEWREQFGRLIFNIDFTPLAETPFHGSTNPIFVHSGLSVIRNRMSAGTEFRDATMIGDTEPSCALVIAHRSTLTINHQGREFPLQPGNAAFLVCWKPGSVGAEQSYGYTAIVANADEWSIPASFVNEHAARPIGRDNGALALLRSYIQVLERRPVRSTEPATMVAAGHHLADLALLTVSNSEKDVTEHRVNSVQAARLTTAISLIEQRYLDANLTPAGAAAALGISVRYLERLLERSGYTFTERVMELRLQTAYRLLSDPAAGGQRIGKIAFDCGFSDFAHFSRRFRQRFGESPGGTRKSR
jgi:AraC-like DNA-binding protein